MKYLAPILVTLLVTLGIVFVVGSYLDSGQRTAKVAARIENQTTCKVVRLRSSTNLAVCVVECSYNLGHNDGNTTSTPVPCEGWYGRSVFRE